MGCLDLSGYKQGKPTFCPVEPQKESTILPSYCVLVFLSRSEMSFATMSINYMRPFVGLELIIFYMVREILETARQKQVRNSYGFQSLSFCITH